MKVGLPFISSTQSGFQWVADRVWKVEHAFERANAAGAKARSARMRIFAILVGLSMAYVCLMIAAASASLLNSPGQIAALTGQANARAQIVDRNGQLLATDVNDYDLFIDPTDMTGPDRTYVRNAMAQIFPQISRDLLDKAFKGEGRTLLVPMLRGADRDRILNYGLPGVSFEAQRVRAYPLGSTGAFYIGMTKRAGEGMSGVEKAFQDQIAGNAIAKDGDVKDQPVQVAMDLRIQGALENEMRAMAIDTKSVGAVGIVTNVRTGEVLAMASYPEFDLNRPGAYDESHKRNHAAVDRYEVGSIFKVISIAVGLDTGTASLNSTYDVSQPLVIGTRKIHDMHSKAPIYSLEDVFIQSSNIGTSRVALNAGVDSVTRYYDAMGLFRSADIELSEPAAPIYTKNPKDWSQLTLAQSAFGQGMAITPLSYAEAVGSVLNGGCLRPLTLKKYDGATPLSCNRVFSAATSRTMLDLMRENVLKGTGGRANAPGLRVGGKTGSAQKPARGGYDATALISSFAAVFPTDGPIDGDRYLVQIMFDSPQGSPLSNGGRLGGAVAAPVAGRVIDRIAPFLGVARKEDKFTTPQWDKAPIQSEDVTGEDH
jgi:cell division protein FtsI (penicillin-binding protein 3)